jgi:hypothetical protein
LSFFMSLSFWIAIQKDKDLKNSETRECLVCVRRTPLCVCVACMSCLRIDILPLALACLSESMNLDLGVSNEPGNCNPER